MCLCPQVLLEKDRKRSSINYQYEKPHNFKVRERASSCRREEGEKEREGKREGQLRLYM